MKTPLRIVVTGLIAQHPLLGGMTWHYLQYLVGLARLGHDVIYIEDSGEWPYNLDGGPSGNDWNSTDCGENVRYLGRVMAAYGLSDSWAYRFPRKDEWFGLSERDRNEAVASCDVLLNVSGSLEHPEDYRDAGCLVYIDSDPVFTQLGLSVGGDPEASVRLDAHDVHFTFGEHLPSWLPTADKTWRPTRQPIVLTEWHTTAEPRPVYTGIMNWTSYEPVSFEGRTFGQKDVEFARFLSLPDLVAPVRLEVALPRLQHAEWERSEQEADTSSGLAVHETLVRAGWSAVDAFDVCNGFEKYRDYILSSKGEWGVAKNGYVRGRPGWFSERSACYLAAGRPVIAQDTGFADVLPTGQGLLPFQTLDDAAYAVREVDAHYARHAGAARAIAAEYFDSEQVLSKLLQDAGSLS